MINFVVTAAVQDAATIRPPKLSHRIHTYRQGAMQCDPGCHLCLIGFYDKMFNNLNVGLPPATSSAGWNLTLARGIWIGGLRVNASILMHVINGFVWPTTTAT